MALKNIGAAWNKSGAKGSYLSGVIELDGKKTSIMIFPNTKKKADKHPDYNIVIREDDPEDVPF